MEIMPYIPLLSALAGALIGAGGTIVTVWLQGNREERRQRRELAFKVAQDMHAFRIQMVRDAGGGRVYPLSAYLAYALIMIEDAEKGRITPEGVIRARKKLDAICQAIEVNAADAPADKPAGEDVAR